jgi:predicted DNA binding CopG/RHH family protein
MQEKHRQRRLPDFSKMTLDKIGDFWDSHDAADYWSPMKEVKLARKPRASRSVSLRLSLDDLSELKKIAAHKGLGHTTMIRSWVRERLHTLHAHP